MVNLLISFQVLEIRIHCPGAGPPYTEGDIIGTAALCRGRRTAAKIQQQPKLIPQSANFEQVFTEEASRPGRGKLMLSGGRF